MTIRSGDHRIISISELGVILHQAERLGSIYTSSTLWEKLAAGAGRNQCAPRCCTDIAAQGGGASGRIGEVSGPLFGFEDGLVVCDRVGDRAIWDGLW